MDPTGAWTQFLDEAADDNLNEAWQSLDDLMVWIESGGFPPDGISRETIQNLRCWLASVIVARSLSKK